MDTAKLRASTKGLVAAVFAGGSLFQVPGVHDTLISMAHNHPHIIGILGTLTGIAGLLHIPQVQEAFGIKTTVTKEIVEVSPEPKQ